LAERARRLEPVPATVDRPRIAEERVVEHQRRDGLEEGGVEEAEILVHPASGLRGVAADQAVPLDVRAARAQLEAPERTERVAYHALRRADHVAVEDVDPGRLLLPAHVNAEEAARHVAIERDL